MNKKFIVLIFSFSIAISLVGFGFYIKEKQKSDNLILRTQNTYLSNINALDESMNNITDTLKKTAYVPDGVDLIKMSSKLYAEGEIAKQSLSNLPSGSKNASTFNKFLSQVGNFAISISKSAIESGEITDKQTDLLLELSDTSKKITDAIRETRENIETISDFAKEIDKKIKKETDTDILADSLDELEEDLSDFPTLIYDGPFSDHILEKSPLMTSNANKMSKEACLDSAKEIFDIKSEDFKFDGNSDGKIECYRFSDENTTVLMSKNGGYVVSMRKNKLTADEKISIGTAKSKANDCLKKAGFEDMAETYYFCEDGICTINYAYLDGQTICYTDLIKVGVSLDDGEIVLMEAGGYLTNHTERAFEVPETTQEQAKEKISKRLIVKKSALALIPTDSLGEKRCYEFLCETQSKEEVLVYISTKTLQTENILILEKSDAGTLVR